MDTKLRLAFRTYFEDGTLPTIPTTDTGAPVYHIPETTDELLAWLPIPLRAYWELSSGNFGEHGNWGAILMGFGHGELMGDSGKTLPEAILRCWLLWKSQETE